MEQQRSQRRPRDPEGAGADTGYPKAFSAYVAELASASDAERRDLAGRINVVLERMRAPGNDTAEAAAIHAALDQHALDDLFDSDGRSCRREAVETLLAMGFPHALTVSPEDFQELRRGKPDSGADLARKINLGLFTLGISGTLVYLLANARTNPDAVIQAAAVGGLMLVLFVGDLVRRKL